MPHFYNSHHSSFGKITVTPKQWWRRKLRKGNFSFLPYAVESKIEFTLTVERIDKPYHKTFPAFFPCVYEVFGNGELRKLNQVSEENKPILVVGRAEYTGDTKFVLSGDGTPAHLVASEGVLLFDDDILSINRYIYGVGGIIFSVILSVILTGACSLCVGILLWLLGFIKIDPAWILRLIK